VAESEQDIGQVSHVQLTFNLTNFGFTDDGVKAHFYVVQIWQ